MQNNKLTACIGVLAVFSLQLSGNALMARSLDAIRVGGDVFLYGDNIEVGIAANGAFGTGQLSDRGIKKGKKLGYISDPSKKKFANGYHGDFFLPGIQEEGWAINLNKKNYNNRPQHTEIKGHFIGAEVLTSTAMAVWQGEINGLEITQTFRIYKAGLAIIIDISLQNTTSSLMEDVYYMRTVDPDNNAEQNNPILDSSYITTNTIIRQGSVNGGAAVVATQGVIFGAYNKVTREKPSTLGLCGHGANSRVAHGGPDSEDADYYRQPEKVYNSAQMAGYSKTEDAPIAIAFKFDKIFPGETVKFRAGYQLADITPPKIDIDENNSSEGLGNTFLQVYKLGDVATKITDVDTSITGLDEDALVGASIKISNAHEGDQIAITGLLPDGISTDTKEKNSDSEIYLTGSATKSAYIKALQQITFINHNTTANTETRHISIMVLDSNYTASTAAESILEIVAPVTLNNDAVTDDNIINANEENNVLLSGTAAPNLPIKIIFTDKNGKKVGKTVTSDENGIWTLANNTLDISALADGEINVKISSTDANGNQSFYEKETQKDSTVLLEIITPKEGEIASSTSPVITGESDPNATITLLLDGNIYITTANDSGQWSYTLPEQALGASITLSIDANDAANNTTSKEITLTIPSIPLEITEVELSTTPIFTGTSTPKTEITVTIPTADGGSESCTTTTDTTGNWSCQLATLPSGGPYTASIKTEDDQGHSTTKTYEVIIPELPLVIENPTDDSNISDSSPIVSGSSNPDSTITVTAIPTGEKCIAIADASGKWSCELPTLPLETNITLSVTTEDDANNIATESITITTPSLPLKITGIDISTTPTFTGTSAPNTKITVTVPISDTKSETCTTITKADGNWSCKLPTLPTGGSYTATVKAEDNHENYATDTQVLSTPELSLSIDSHADVALITDATPTISGTSTPATNITLTTTPTGPTCTTITNAEGHWSCQLPELPLSKTIDVTIKTEDGINSKTKTISLTTPALPISIKGVEASTTPSITGTSTADTLITVNIVIDNLTAESCTATTDNEGNWSCQISALPSGGPYSATVTADDGKGNTSSITEDFSVPQLPLIINSPTNNAVISGITPTVSGTSLPGTNITVTTSSGQSCTAITDSSNHWACELDSLILGVSSTLTVITEDSAGNKTTEEIGIKTDKLPLDIITPGDKETASDDTPTFVGISAAGANITVNAGTEAQCQTVADENGNWSCELTPLPVGGSYTVNIKAEDDQDNVTEIIESIKIPEIDLVITSPKANETITGTSFVVTGISDPNTPITVLGADGEKCSTTSDDNGKWSCELENLQSGNGKYITVISGNEEQGQGQKFALVRVDIKNSAEKVTTIIKGGAGGLSLFFLFLLSLTLLPKFVRLMRTIINKNKV